MACVSTADSKQQRDREIDGFSQIVCDAERDRSNGIHGDVREMSFCAGRVICDEIVGTDVTCAD